VPIVNVPKALRDKLGEEGIEALGELINLATDQAKDHVLVLAGEKYERRLSGEGAKLNSRLAEEGARLDRRIAEEVAKVERKLAEKVSRHGKLAGIRTQVADVRADLLRWMFVFRVGQIGAVLGILFAFFR